MVTTLNLGGAVEKLDTEALAMVPKGKVLDQSFREVTVKTESGTKVKLEFERQGKLQEASGLNLNRGDEFEPGSGLISLSTAAQSASKSGHQVKGGWNLEKDPQYGWVYELAEEETDRKLIHLVNAKNGKVVRSINAPRNSAHESPASSPQNQQEEKH